MVVDKNHSPKLDSRNPSAPILGQSCYSRVSVVLGRSKAYLVERELSGRLFEVFHSVE